MLSNLKNMGIDFLSMCWICRSPREFVGHLLLHGEVAMDLFSFCPYWHVLGNTEVRVGVLVGLIVAIGNSCESLGLSCVCNSLKSFLGDLVLELCVVVSVPLVD